MRNTLYCCIAAIALFHTAAGQIGFGTTSPNSSLDVRGATAFAIRSFTGNTTAGSDEVLVFTGTSATTLSLPDATTCIGRIYWIKNASTTLPTPVLSLSPAASQTMEGSLTWTMDEPNETLRIVSDGSNWQVLNEGVPVRKAAGKGGTWNEGGNRVVNVKQLGTITSYDFPFVTNGTEKMRLTTSGYLGIGTNNPQGRLHLVTDNDDVGNDYTFSDYGASITTGIWLRKIRGTVAAPANLQTGDFIGQWRFSGRFNGSMANGTGSGLDAYYRGSGTTNLSDLRFFSSNTERMRIDENGRAGIGTSTWDATNPEKLIVDAGTTSSYNVISGRGEIDNYLQLNIQNRSAGNTASSDIVATADNGSESDKYIDMGMNSSGYSNSGIPILNGVNEAYLFSTGTNLVIGNGSTGYDLAMFTAGYATSNERIRILANGNVGIGTSTPADKLSVAGLLTPTANGAYSLGKITQRWTEVWAANGTIQTSDFRAKTNIEPLESGIGVLAHLQPVRFNWKQQPHGAKQLGLIAQEVRKWLPEVVIGDEHKEKLGLNYAELVPVLVKAIQEQQAILKTLRTELDKLETK